MRTRRWYTLVWIILALISSGLSTAAPLPLLWPLEGLGGRVGWRYERGFTSWPGPYWRGPAPVCAIST